MTRGRRLGILVACAAAVLVVAAYAGSRFEPPAPAPSAGSVRLGPEAGEPVAAYLARLPAELPPPGPVVHALVQFTAEQTTEAAALAVAGTTPVTAILRVPLSRVQTALRFEALDRGLAPAAALAAARERAWLAATGDVARSSGRAQDVAAAEATALAAPGCPCVLAVVVQADRVGLDAVAARSGVRAVHAAPAGVTTRELAVAPLLPGQVDRVDPLPDDAVVPP